MNIAEYRAVGKQRSGYVAGDVLHGMCCFNMYIENK